MMFVGFFCPHLCLEKRNLGYLTIHYTSTLGLLQETFLPNDLKADRLLVELSHVTASTTAPEFARCTTHGSRNFATTEPGAALEAQNVPTVCAPKKGAKQKHQHMVSIFFMIPWPSVFSKVDFSEQRHIRFSDMQALANTHLVKHQYSCKKQKKIMA